MNLEAINKNIKIIKILSVVTIVAVIVDAISFLILSEEMMEELLEQKCFGLFTCLGHSIAASAMAMTVDLSFTFLFANFVLAILITFLIYSNKDKRYMAPFVVTILTTVTCAIGVFLNFGAYDLVAAVPLALIITILVFIIKIRKLTKVDSNNNMQVAQQVTQQVTYQDNSVQPMAIPNQAVEQPVIQQPVAQIVEQQPVVQSQSQQVQTQPTTTQPVQSQEPNTMIDLNNLTPEKKDQLLKVLLQNNQKTNE